MKYRKDKWIENDVDINLNKRQDNGGIIHHYILLIII